MPMIKILQKDEGAGVFESYIIDTQAIAELHCRYPIVSDEPSEDAIEDEDQQSETQADDVDQDIDILYMNGEHTVINTTVPTSFLLFLEGGEMVCKTTKMQEFETAYLDASVQNFQEAESSE